MNLKLVVCSISIGLVSLFSNVYGGAPETRLLFSISQNTIRLGVINSSKQDLDLEIVSKKGNAFLNKTTKKGTNYFQMFDASTLPEGDYTVLLSGGELNIKKKFSIENRKLVLKRVIEPKFSLLDNETLLVFFSNPSQNAVDIALERNNEVVFEDSRITEAVLNKRYSLKKVPKGYYTLRFLVDEELYRYSFEVK